MTTPTKLFEPYKLGPITLPNRLVMAPLTRNRAVPPDMVPSELAIEYYGQRANGRNPAYESSKAAQIALGRAIARAGEDKGVRCNVIAPGMMDTPMGRDASRRRPDRGLTVPFGRQGTGWEVAYAALFLISNESSYVNAHTLFLDAGHMAGIVRS